MTKQLQTTQAKEMVYTMENGDEMRLTFDTVRKYLVQGNRDFVTDSEILYFMHECKARRLNPFLRQAWLIKYAQKENAQIVEAIQHKRNKARKDATCRGWKKGVIVHNKETGLRYSNGLVLENETILGGWFKATPTDWDDEFILEINLKQYIKKTKDGSITSFWKPEKQAGMIAKVAESQGLSTLWGDTVGNSIVEEEILPETRVDPIPMEQTGGFFQREQQKDDGDFDAMVMEKIDWPGDKTMERFLNETAAGNDISIEKLKEEAVKNFEMFWASFEDWRKKTYPESQPTEENPALWDRPNWINLKEKGFSTFIWKKGNIEILKDAPADILLEMQEKWDRMYDNPFPVLDVEPEPEPDIKTPNGLSDGAKAHLSALKASHSDAFDMTMKDFPGEPDTDKRVEEFSNQYDENVAAMG